jgi:cytoskeletal protein RodZ
VRFRRRYRSRLPSPLEVVIYMVAVIAFCVINWLLLKANDTEQPVVRKSFETVVAESMLKALTPVMKPPSRNRAQAAFDLGAGREDALEFEAWMISLDAFSSPDAEVKLSVEDWMLSTSSWHDD